MRKNCPFNRKVPMTIVAKTVFAIQISKFSLSGFYIFSTFISWWWSKTLKCPSCVLLCRHETRNLDLLQYLPFDFICGLKNSKSIFWGIIQFLLLLQSDVCFWSGNNRPHNFPQVSFMCFFFQLRCMMYPRKIYPVSK